MMNSELHHKIFHLNGHDFQQHCNSIGEYLRELRVKRDLSTADIEIICAQMQADFLHSSVGAIHSNYIRTMLKCHQTPFRISLRNCQFKAVSAIIDWMYTGEIEITAEEYGEHFKVVSGLGVNKLQQNLENTLQILAAQNDFIICCINVATDPECLVSSMVRSVICERFVEAMHTLSDSDIQKLTSNAIMELVSSPLIKSTGKIDAVNFALQWLKNASHSRFLDAVLGSLYIEALRSDQLIALVQHLRRLYQELPKSLLAPVHVYVCNKQIVVSSDPKKYAKSSNVIVPNPTTDSGNETESQKSKSVEMIGNELSASYIAEINQLPSFEELVQIYQPITNNSQEIFDGHVIAYKSFPSENQKISEKHCFSQQQQFLQPNDEGTRLAAAGTVTEQSDNATTACHSFGTRDVTSISSVSNQFTSRKSDSVTAASTDERTIGRNAFTTDSLRDIQLIRSPFSRESPVRSSCETINRYAFGSESIADINQVPIQFSDRSRTPERLISNPYSSLSSFDQPYSRRAFGVESLADLRDIPDQFSSQDSKTRKNAFSPSTETINRNVYGVESILDIESIPKQFFGKRYFTPILEHYPGGSRAIYNLTEQIRQAKDKMHNLNYYFKQGDLQTLNRYAFGEQSLADLREIQNPFSMKYYGTDSLLDSRSSPHKRYTISEIEDINAHPEFVREDQVIGKKAFTREECEELRGIPSITDSDPKKSPIINRYELSDNERSDIQKLPDIVDSQYTIGRNMRSEEEIQEMKELPDMWAHLPIPQLLLITACFYHISTSFIIVQQFDSPATSEYMMHRP
uniref:BTB domain-containing protein n=1 Tax=Setaria digitata TaxID=48799 RepID=A0A915PP23_9BILA